MQAADAGGPDKQATMASSWQKYPTGVRGCETPADAANAATAGIGGVLHVA